MSDYANVVGGKLKLKGKALDVKTGGFKTNEKKKKKKKKQKKLHSHFPHAVAIGSHSQVVGASFPNLLGIAINFLFFHVLFVGSFTLYLHC